MGNPWQAGAHEFPSALTLAGALFSGAHALSLRANAVSFNKPHSMAELSGKPVTEGKGGSDQDA